MNGFMNLMEGPSGPRCAGTPIGLGVFILVLAGLLVKSLSATYAAIAIGVLAATVASFVVLMAMPRAMQISIMSAAIGVSADAGYAKINDETPVTVANGLVKLADGLRMGDAGDRHDQSDRLGKNAA